jgi:hypothetical protein
MNKPAGLLTKLVGGKPKLSGMEYDLTGKKIADVKGWAPTEDGLLFVKNGCYDDEKLFSGHEMIIPGDTYTIDTDDKATATGVAKDTVLSAANDVTLAMLLNDEVDGVWIYADQAYLYDCSLPHNSNPSHACDMWAKWKTDFAYVQVGQYDHARNGTTLTKAKKGAGIA